MQIYATCMLSQVSRLMLSADIFEKLELEDDLSTSFSTFNNLITLEVSFIKTEQAKSLFTFSQFSPYLESLVFGGVCCRGKVDEGPLTLDVVPHCLLTNLEAIKFQYFEGQVRELDLVQLFLSS
ncbi:uncharacterized protein LOC113299932 [Papaver somniferum]|uniref:uncharacterized protein LOC113299932 n=1 Tax=Papaver somniferum TaxID=3469 RepID=UPI000E6FED7E|nr:uncharacterized protein LOC113299932 [Papaver somniferum]